MFYNTKKNNLTSGHRPATWPHFPPFGRDHLLQPSRSRRHNHPILYEAVDLNLKENYANKQKLKMHMVPINRMANAIYVTV